MQTDSPNFKKFIAYIEKSQVASLSTVDKHSNPLGIGVFTFILNGDTPSFNLPKDTPDYQNLVAHPTIALTAYNVTEASVLQTVGEAFVVTDTAMKEDFKRRHMETFPNVDLGWGDNDLVTIFGINIKHARLTEFTGNNILDRTVTEI